jgi:hypothetical protein
LHVKIDVTHSDEMNDKIFDIDIDWNIWGCNHGNHGKRDLVDATGTTS